MTVCVGSPRAAEKHPAPHSCVVLALAPQKPSCASSTKFCEGYPGIPSINYFCLVALSGFLLLLIRQSPETLSFS